MIMLTLHYWIFFYVNICSILTDPELLPGKLPLMCAPQKPRDFAVSVLSFVDCCMNQGAIWEICQLSRKLLIHVCCLSFTNNVFLLAVFHAETVNQFQCLNGNIKKISTVFAYIFVKILWLQITGSYSNCLKQRKGNRRKKGSQAVLRGQERHRDLMDFSQRSLLMCISLCGLAFSASECAHRRTWMPHAPEVYLVCLF